MTAYFEKLGQNAAEEFLKEFGKLLSPDPSATDPEAAAPEEDAEEDVIYALDEAARILQKIEANVDEGTHVGNSDLLEVTDRYIRIAGLAFQYGL